MIWLTLWLVTVCAGLYLHFWWKRRLFLAQNEAAKKMDELAREQHRFATHASAEKEALFNSMVEGVVVLDPESRVRLANRAAVILFSLSADIVGKTMLEIVRIHELNDVIRRLSSEEPSLGVELTLPGLEERVFEVNAAAIFDREGQHKGTILVFHDVTRIKKLEKTRQEFVANVSHELRTPLALIKGYVETLIDGAKDNPETQDRFLKTIERNANRLALIIEDLLTIARLESGKIVLKFAAVEIRQSVVRVVDDFQSRSSEKGVSLINSVPEGLMVWADGERIGQVLSNLLDNAIKYGRSNGTVVVEAHLTSEKKVEVSVRDNGPGIPPDAVGRIFERFYRVDKARSRDQGGTGLGLAIVKHIVQSHGGKVWVTSEPKVGSTFFFTLQFSDDEDRS